MTKIVPPQENVYRAGTRAIIEALAQATPLTAGLARLYQFTHPSKAETEFAECLAKISARINEHSAILDELTQLFLSRLIVSDVAVALAMKLVKTEKEGLETAREYDDVRCLVPDQDDGAIQEALHELEDYGFLTTHATSRGPVGYIILRYDIYFAFDRMAMGYDTIGDARKLAELLLEDEERGSIRKLFKDVGWLRRRFNPALACVLRFFEEEAISEECQPDFPTYNVWMDSRVRFRLRRFVADGQEAERRA